jgi:GNAT superfamily N-acetyltransferase
MEPEITFISLSAEELLADEQWWAIYDEAFPANERESSDVILRSLREQVGMAFGVREGGKTIALATTHLLQNPAAVFLVYLATAKGLRGRGIGGQLLEFAWKESAARVNSTQLILEVDAQEIASGPEKEIRERRVGFFGRHGLKLMSYPYKQPPVDGIAPVVMSLMVRTAEGQSEPDPEMLASLVRAIYFEKYQAMNGIPSGILQTLLDEQ